MLPPGKAARVPGKNLQNTAESAHQISNESMTKSCATSNVFALAAFGAALRSRFEIDR